LKVYGNDEKFVPYFNNKPNYLKPEIRKQITKELIANRYRIIESLNNKNRQIYILYKNTGKLIFLKTN
jgi:hypothetical protein